MARPRVVSREYKVMLRPNRFTGDDGSVLQAAGAFWRDFTRATAGIAARTDGALARPGSQRLINFLDTRLRGLNAGRYIFRDRRDLGSDRREVTLKFRHPDRHVAANRDMDPARKRKHARTKFEEDIKAPFVSLYSFSTTVRVGDGMSFSSVGDVARIFPDLCQQCETLGPEEPLELVNGFTARELVVGGGTMRIGRKPATEAECALIVWHPQQGRRTQPCAVEFSYRYGNDAEEYDGASRPAFEVFDALQTKLGAWVDPKPRTKTAFVYNS